MTLYFLGYAADKVLQDFNLIKNNTAKILQNIKYCDVLVNFFKPLSI